MKPDNRDLTDTRCIRDAFCNVMSCASSVFLADNYTDAQLELVIRDLRYLLRVAEGK